MRALALAACVGVMTGCSLLWSLDGLEGGPCQGACADGSVVGIEQDASAAADSFLPMPETSDTADTAEAADAPGPVLDTGMSEVSAAEAACTPPTLPTLDDCQALAAMPAAPVIDGVLDCGVALWDMPLAGWTGTGSVPAGIAAQIGAAWRTDGLYLFVRVTGEGPHRYPAPAGDGQWCGDAVELFVDAHGTYSDAPAYNVPGTMQFIVVAPSDAMTTASVGEEFQNASDQGPWSGEFVTLRTADGFDAEAFVKAADLGLATWTLAAGGHVGLDVAVDLGNPAGTPASCPALGQFQIQRIPTDAACSKPACNVDEFCNPLLQ